MAEITLTQNLVSLVDEEDYERFRHKTWCAALLYRGTRGRGLRFYARRTVLASECLPLGAIFLHREILGIPFDSRAIVDHINGNSLDNRRSNLRIATQSENCHNVGLTPRNTSGLKGVSFNRFRGLWVARITVDRKLFYLGGFGSREEAYVAYCNAARMHRGEFARLA